MAPFGTLWTAYWTLNGPKIFGVFALLLSLPTSTWLVSFATISSINGISQSLLAFEMVVERSLGEVGCGQNCIDPGTLEAVSVNLPKSRLQQVFSRALRITQPSLRALPVMHI